MKTALTIAGSDTCAGAGIQADLKTFSANGVYGQTVITALTAQNTMGVNDVLEVPDDFFREEIDAVCSDIFPDAVKIGMVESSAKIRIIFEGIEKYNLMHIVLDPLMISTSGHKLLQDEAVGTLTEMLFPKAELITPNIPEAEELVKDSIDSKKKCALQQRRCRKNITRMSSSRADILMVIRLMYCMKRMEKCMSFTESG